MSDEALAKLMHALLVIVALAIIGIMTIDTKTQNKCLVMGYPDHHVTLTLNSYCVRRFNQTDEVKALP